MRGAGWTQIESLSNPIGFVLWLTEGYAACLEGFTLGDSTVGLDFATVRFTVPFFK